MILPAPARIGHPIRDPLITIVLNSLQKNSVTLHTGEVVELASLKERVAAKVVDWMLLCVFITVPYIIYMTAVGIISIEQIDPADQLEMSMIRRSMVIAVLAIIFLYEPIMLTRKGQDTGPNHHKHQSNSEARWKTTSTSYCYCKTIAIMLFRSFHLYINGLGDEWSGSA